ncbi:MAG: hypothetical protein ACLQVI_32515, partial [Polyangiaceae bacterium]
MSTELLHPSPAYDGGSAPGAEEEVDPELLALPPPARGQRQLTVAMLLLVALTGSLMAYSLGGDATYALTPAAQ